MGARVMCIWAGKGQEQGGVIEEEAGTQQFTAFFWALGKEREVELDPGGGVGAGWQLH